MKRSAVEPPTTQSKMLKSGTPRHSTMEYLEQLSNKSSKDILTELSKKNINIQELIQNDASGDVMYFFVGILSKIAATSFSVEKTTIMSKVCKSDLLNKLILLIMLLPTQMRTSAKTSSETLCRNIDTFLMNIVSFCLGLLDVAPANAINEVSKLVQNIQVTMGNLESKPLKNANSVMERLTILEQRLHICIKELNKKPDVYCLEGEPQNNFREISIYPTSEEILQFTRSVLRKNKVVGRYKNVDEYLDIHFRLLREDFVKPLREGVKEYILQQNSGASTRKHSFTVKAFKNVKFLELVYVNGEIGRKIQLDHKSFLKDFIYGSLVCFTKDYFKTMIFGRVVSTDHVLLRRRQIVVILDTKVVESTTVEYIMIECDVYFEPYYVVLKTLQKLQDWSFPLKQFIVDVCPTINPPKYLQKDTKYMIHGRRVQVLHKNWPDEKHFKLNEMQYKGFRRALTKELVIIQGPPGTGKTHLGLKIVKTLLHNKEYWYKQESRSRIHLLTSRPMLVLCYTNHALDQFLEGILKFTTRIVRVGGRSKSEQLKNYNLREISRKFESKSESLKLLKTGLINTAMEIKKLNSTLDIIKHCEGIIDFREFDVEEIEPEFESSWFAKRTKYEIKLWLTGNINKRAYIEELELNHLLKYNSNPHFEAPNEDLLSELTSLRTTDEADRRIEIHSGFEKINTHKVKLNLTVDLRQMRKELKDYKAQLETPKSINADVLVNNKTLMSRMCKLEMVTMTLEQDVNYLQLRLLEGKKIKLFEKPVHTDLNNPYKMGVGDRWRLYFYWLDLYKQWAENRIYELADAYLEMFAAYEGEKAFNDVKLMRKYDVIGMTTTGAARLQSSLQKLKCPIVVVEEAAELLESHIVASLTNHCQHLILIGDHQQLRPKTADYSIEKNMQLGISLFERFIMNKFEYSRLNIQHRMRPEISSLICPAIYPRLIDHPSVMNYPPVKGIGSSVYFLDHSEGELACGNSSKKNLHEAKFLVRLAQHLLYNGYAPTDITILVAYLGQYSAVMQELKELELKDVSCAVLDNFQGEENKIILLSLVRNNNNDSIGFLKTENRVCVALSRAKEGLYIMGNMELLCRNSEIWPKVKNALVAQKALGKHLVLCCQIHMERTVQVKYPNNFDQVPNGCCGQICGLELNCGHKCELFCHVVDPDHKDYKCKQRCSKVLCGNIDHMCKKLCFQPCGLCEYEVERRLSCGHTHRMPCHTNVQLYKCHVLIETSFPVCGHFVKVPCYENLNEIICRFPCEKHLEKCGHICTLTCHVNKDPEHKEYRCKQRCSKNAANCSLDNEKHRCKNRCSMECEPCSEMVEKQKASCKHVFKVPCSKNVDDYVGPCSYPCDKLLQCGHECQNKCGFPCTTNCRMMVEKVSSVCDHNIACECGDDNFEINSQCQETVVITNPAACGHKFVVPCYVKQLQPDDPLVLAFCPEKCTFVLACGHTCTGTCFECFEGRFHKACTALCERNLICGHKCQLPCGVPCEPCFQKCDLLCVHNKCRNRCGQQCFPCNKKCARSCMHATCSAICSYQYCTVSACLKLCRKTLPCGHDCTGFCGEVCPSCRICNGRIVKTGERYITLQECGHVFEIKEIKELLERPYPVGVKVCPVCKTPLCLTHRFKDYIWEGISEKQYILKDIYTNFNYKEDLKWMSYVEDLTEQAGIKINANIATATESACFHFKKEVLILLSKHLRSVKIELQNAWRMCYCEVVKFLKTTERFFNNPTFSMQETTDILNEFKRCTNKLNLIVILIAFDRKFTQTDFNSLYVRNKICLDDRQRKKIDRVISLIFSVREFTNVDDIAVKTTLKSLDTYGTLKNIASSEEPNLPTVVNYSSESWFKCSEGHLSPFGHQKDPSCRVCGKNKTDIYFPYRFENNERFT